MRGLKQLPLGCLTVILIAVVVWVAIQIIFLPAAERHVEGQGHTLKDYTDCIFHGR